MVGTVTRSLFRPIIKRVFLWLDGLPPPPSGNLLNVEAYRHDESRKNLPPAKIAGEGKLSESEKQRYTYSPRFDPKLRFDRSKRSDLIFDIIAKSRRERLNEEEQNILTDALSQHEPWLEWAGKQEQNELEVDSVALHEHERVSTQAILDVAKRRDVDRDLFGDPQLPYHQAVQFYKHDVDWVNRLILGDSLQVMSSLANREDLSGKVQMIYMDPPYGINYGGNFQQRVGKRETGTSEKHVTREIEQIKAYRDSWTLGVHSYLSYLRDRLILAKTLLKESGSIFVQIGEENLANITLLLDEVFDRKNRVQTITFKKKSSTKKGHSIVDYIVWYAREKSAIKMPDVFKDPGSPEESLMFNKVLLPTGERCRYDLLDKERQLKYRNKILRDNYPVVSQLSNEKRSKPIVVQGKTVSCGKNCSWRYNPEIGMKRLERSERLRITGASAGGVVFWNDGRLSAITNVWIDIHGAANPVYVVQTNHKVVERCMLMSTEPGDLVLDPTCGSGTTAYVAEKWGRRWITIDTSRVSLAVARQRMLTSNFDYYELKNTDKGVGEGLRYGTVSKVTLQSIANNENLDPILDKHDEVLEEYLLKCNQALADISGELKRTLRNKLEQKKRTKGKLHITEGDERRWILPVNDEKFEHWTVPFDTDPDWPEALSRSVTEYRQAWREKMDEVNKCIKDNAEQTELVDKPVKVSGITRVSGPFTVEAVQPPEMTKVEESDEAGSSDVDIAKNAEAYLTEMIGLLKVDGVRFQDNKRMKFSSLEPIHGRTDAIHAEGTWKFEDGIEDNEETVAVAIGPQYGSVTAMHLENLIKPASRSYDHLVVAGFGFDGTAKTIFDEDPHPRLRIHMAHIRPDINPGMKGLLKEQKGAQLFTVFGQPRVTLSGPDKDDCYTIELSGVDIYDPVENTIKSSNAKDVASWFIDSDYDGRTFCITQAFFPDKTAWKKLSKALKTVIDESVFEKFSGSVSLPFEAGKHKRVAVKVIDPRGNEVMRVLKIGDSH